MKRLMMVLLVAGCSSSEFTSVTADGGASTLPEGGRAGSVGKGGQDVGSRAATGGSASTSGAPATAGETASSAGDATGGAPMGDGGMPSGGELSTHEGGSAGAAGESLGGSSLGGQGGLTAGSSSGSGGTGGFSICPRESQMVWKFDGFSCTCDSQCNRTKAQCTGMEGESCMNAVTCTPDCNKPTPDSCGEANIWHSDNGVCACGDCVKSLTGCKLGNQCLLSTDGLTCKEAC